MNSTSNPKSPQGASEERPAEGGQPRAEALQDEGEQRPPGGRGEDEGGARGGGCVTTCCQL